MSDRAQPPRQADTGPGSASPPQTPAPAPGSGQDARPSATAAAPATGSPPGQPNQPPQVTLPKGGGAIRGIGETFQTNPVTGTASLSVPLPVSPGRAGFAPRLALGYDSGAGNGPFGLGWNLGLPSITRKTDKGLPRYDDAGESDQFILTGSEDLAAVMIDQPLPDRQEEGITYAVTRYRPRVDQLFARIERWTPRDGSPSHWRSISRENVTTLYGKTAESRIADPADPHRVFSWLICQSYDDKGNAVVYSYRAEDAEGIFDAPDGAALGWAHERNRDPLDLPGAPDPRSANRYPWRIRYGNRTPNRDADWRATDPTTLDDADWMFEIVFDYGADHYTEEPPDANEQVFATAQAAAPAGSQWPARPDRFSTYRAGFEVRTYRLCRRVLLFHHFPDELAIPDCLARATEFAYAESPVATVMTGITQSGYARQPQAGNERRYLKKSLPALELEYSQLPTPEALAEQPIEEIDAESLENLPYGVDGAVYQWIDLDGEGASGILTEQADAWFYKRNLSANNGSDDGRVRARFGPAELVRERPAAGLGRGGQFMDLAGDGHNDLVQMTGPVRGFSERTSDDGWSPFRPFVAWPTIDTRDPNLKFVDLDGDGLTDILVTEHEAFRWYRSLAEEGFAPGLRVAPAFDEERGPRLVFADGTNSIYLADMSGDGLSDLVRIRNSEICYWPNLGHGRFGSRVTMDDAPRFDHPDLFDQRRIRLADIDGSGVTDVIYLGRDGVRLYLNQSGNRWSPAVTLPQFAPLDNLAAVQTVDLLGAGTICLVWSSPLPSLARRPMRYIDLMGGTKPHLLRATRNNLGAETRIDYAPSTRFYLDDRAAGTPWITRLAFPVQCVARVETIDWISRNRFVTTYTYHHGYFDGEEREFRGFGRVDQVDTEAFATLAGDGAMPEAANWEAASHVPPMETRTWYHTGAFLDRDRVSRLFIAEYSPPIVTDDDATRARLLDDTILPDGLTPDEEREACRALKGMMLRQETFARDGTAREAIPYVALEQNFAVERIQARGGNRHAIFSTHPLETIAYHYERDADDPRVTHTLTLEVDPFSNVLKSADVAYRRLADPDPAELPLPEDRAQQTTTRITYTENRFTTPIDATDDYRAPLACETRTYELSGFATVAAGGRVQAGDLVERSTPGDERSPLVHRFAGEVAYEEPLPEGATKQRRLIEQVRTLYRPDDLGAGANDPLALLPLGTMGALALPGETCKLAFTPGLLAQVYARPLDTVRPPDVPPPVALLPAPGDVLPVDAAAGGADRGGYLSSEALRGRGVFPATPDAAGWTRADEDGHWWLPAGRVFYSPGAADAATAELAGARGHFYLPRRYRDPFAADVTVTYDGHDLLPVATRDAVGNAVRAELVNYRALQPERIADANGNRSQVAFDALGLVAGTALMGKSPPAPAEGDALDGFRADLTRAETDSVLEADDPRAPARPLLARATTRVISDVDRFQRSRREHPDDPGQWLPAYAATVIREMHDRDLPPGTAAPIQVSFAYSDGFGRDIQKKIPAEPGPVVAGGPVVNPRWVGSGWTIFNNKGKPVRQYEPFFSRLSKGHHFEFGVAVGVSPILFYDPPGRVVATLHPNRSWEKVVFTPWRQATWDANDTIALDPYTDDDVSPFFRRLAPSSEESLPHGLRATYFARPDLTEPALTRIDPNIDILWAMGAPADGIGVDGFSVRWSGRLRPDVSETFTISTKTDDGVRVWIDNQLLIDRFTSGGNIPYSATIDLEAGRFYDLRVDYFEESGNANATLSWQSASTAKAPIPAANLFVHPPTWYALRADPLFADQAAARWPDAALRSEEQAAAAKTLPHANTPTVAHLDSLGRVFLTLAHNGFDDDGTARRFPARLLLDIEGNQREVRDAVVQSGDARGRLVARYRYDLLGHRIHQASMEAGERWLLSDVAGKPIRAWDSRGHAVVTAYDPLRRPLRTSVIGADPAQPDLAHLVERVIYGEQHPDAANRNLRGQAYRHCDQAGVATTEQFDFKGNALVAERRLARDYTATVDWSAVDAVIPADASAAMSAADMTALETAIDLIAEAERFTSATHYDALNRPLQLFPPRSDQPGAPRNVIQPVYNEAGLLERLHVWLDIAAAPTGLLDPQTTPPSKAGVTNIDYDAKGQRLRIDYQNGASTRYAYDPETFRLTALYTRRGASFAGDCGDADSLFAAPEEAPAATPCGLQNLRYTYDPVGNITHIRDDAQQPVYFRNQRVEPSADYTYDPLYRLTVATGREHLGQIGNTRIAWPHGYNDLPRRNIPHPGDGNAMGRYEETYAYDAVGNFETMQHRSLVSGVESWTRAYVYAEPSLLEAGKTSNRLTSATVGTGPTETYGGASGYDAHGNMRKMPQLAILQWDFQDRLQMTQRQAVNADDTEGEERKGERTWYVYDAAGQRVRKVTEKAMVTPGGDAIKDERIYLGGFEIYRRHGSDALTRETLHVMDDTRRIALVETRTAGADGSPRELIRVQFGNHLGTAALELDQDAQIISYEEYSPYGSTVYQAMNALIGASPKRYRYIGKERDEETGFGYHGARYYAPWLGRWTSCDPEGTKDGPNLFRYARCNPNRLADPNGKQTTDPMAPPPVSGFGVTISGGKVQVGPLSPTPLQQCDELNPQCKPFTFSLDQSRAPTSQPDQSGGDGGAEQRPFNPLSLFKTYSPAPNKGVVWRITNPSVDPDPMRHGMTPKDPAAKYSPGEHALGEHLPPQGTGKSQYISASHKPGGASGFEGEPYAIDPKKVTESGTPMHDTPDIVRDLDRMANEGRVHPERVDIWKGAQESREGVPVKPGQPPKGEVLFEGPIPPEAVESGGARALKGVGRGLFWFGVALTVYDLGSAAKQSWEQGSIKPFVREAVRQATTWGLAIGGAKVGAAIGTAIGGPIGTIVGGVIGGLVGGIAGYIGGSWLASLF